MRWQSGRTSALGAKARPIAQPDPDSLSMVAVNRHSEWLANGGTPHGYARVCRPVYEFVPASVRIHVELRLAQDLGLRDGEEKTTSAPSPEAGALVLRAIFARIIVVATSGSLFRTEHFITRESDVLAFSFSDSPSQLALVITDPAPSQNGCRVRFNAEPKHPEILELLEKVSLPQRRQSFRPRGLLRCPDNVPSRLTTLPPAQPLLSILRSTQIFHSTYRP
jgi:hypothetical protein